MRASLLLLALAAVLAGSASAATPAPAKLLLTVKDLPSGFRVTRPARPVTAKGEAREFDVNTARFGRVAGASASFKRDVTEFDDRAVNEVNVHLIVFRSNKGAHAAYRALAAKERSLFAVHVGDESVGAGLSSPDVNVRWVWWRHENAVATVVASYFGGRPNVQSLIDLARVQQSRVARGVR